MMNTSPVTKIKKTYFYGGLGIILGLIIGLLIGWVFWPVTWTDASLAQLRPDMQRQVMSNAIMVHALTGDQQQAKAIYSDFGNQANSVINDVTAQPGLLSLDQIKAFTTSAGAAAPAGQAGTVATAVENPGPVDKKSTGTLGMILLALLVAGAVAVYWFFFRNREKTVNASMVGTSKQMKPEFTPAKTEMQAAASKQTPFQPAPQPQRVETPAIYNRPNPVAAARPEQMAQQEAGAVKTSSLPAGKPIAQFLSTYMYGDDLYDESFIFDAPNGAFLGECGIGFSDLVGTGEPKKVSAFEVWLFDKNDVQTVTSILMSRHAYEDPFMRENLTKKGVPVLAGPDQRFTMETASLVLEAHVVDLNYGELLQTPESYFQRVTLELAVYEK